MSAEPRHLPHAAEAELAVLGGVLLRGGDVLEQLVRVLEPQDFYAPRAAAVWATMLQLRETVAARVSDPAMDEAAQVALSAEILRQVGAISAGRDFHGRAGRHLQWLLGDISDGAGLMRDAPRLQAKRLGLLRVAETLNFYGREYDHPGWEPIKP